MFGASGSPQHPPDSAGDAAAAAFSAAGAHQGSGVSSIMAEIGDENGKDRGGGSDESAERGIQGGGSGVNRWPRQETLALIKIRSDMDLAFRDSSLKGPLWEEVARKMGEMGYNRSAKKCREKFENVYKYHKRTKEGRSSKSDSKNYRFFDQLEALFTHHHPSSSAATALPPPPEPAIPISVAMPPPQPPPVQPSTVATFPITVPSTATTKAEANPVVNFPSSPSRTASSSSSLSTSSDEEIHSGSGARRRKRKRKWKGFFERLMKEVTRKQEDLQRKFLEAVEERERDRTAREESWKVQETARLNRQHDLLVQERSLAAAKDAALVSYLQKLSDDHHHIPPPPPPPLPAIDIQPPPPPPAQPQPQPDQQLSLLNVNATNNNVNGDHSVTTTSPVSSSRWPKAEVEALINLRSSLDQKYVEGGGGVKGPLWEEISLEMKKIGYNRNAKRCKEKWENINKYFKKVKESNKKRPEDSKTCPYFHQLDALYRQKNKQVETAIVAQPEQQWPLPPQQRVGNLASEDGDWDEDGDEDESSSGYEIVANNTR